jgi:hypothetical protein
MLNRIAVVAGLLIGSIAIAFASSETLSTWFVGSNPNPVLTVEQAGTTAEPAFTCELHATVSAANTTAEIVALSAGKTIRVCAFLLGNATAGTFKFVDGTGTACATSPSDLTTAMGIADKAIVPLAAGRGSLFRTRSGRALCMTAGTGTVTGVVTYTIF